MVLSPPGRSAEVRPQIERWLESRGLALNASKTRTVNVTQESIRFLGFGLKVRRSRKGRQYAHVEPTGASCAALREKVRDILNHRTQWRAIADVVREVNAKVRGWSPFGSAQGGRGYFHYGNSAGVFAKLRYWLDNRLRRWLWRKHGCRGGLYKHYTHDQLKERHGLWSLPQSAAWTAA